VYNSLCDPPTKKFGDPCYNAIELIKVLCDAIKHIFPLIVYVMAYVVHWANNETAAIEIFSNTHQKKWRHIV